MSWRIPSALLLLAETASAAELGMLLWRYSDLMRQPHGKGEPVVVLPGFATDDTATWVLRRYLKILGYKVCGWGLGINRGYLGPQIPHVNELVKACANDTGQRVRLVGWSLGGVIAREIARDEPEYIERVITLGSPIGGPKYTGARHWLTFRGHDLDAVQARIERRNRIPIRVPVTAICAKYDGIVPPEASIDHWGNTEHVEVPTTHIGLGLNPLVYRIIAQRLATATTTRRMRPKRPGSKRRTMMSGSGDSSAQSA